MASADFVEYSELHENDNILTNHCSFELLIPLNKTISGRPLEEQF